MSLELELREWREAKATRGRDEEWYRNRWEYRDKKRKLRDVINLRAGSSNVMREQCIRWMRMCGDYRKIVANAPSGELRQKQLMAHRRTIRMIRKTRMDCVIVIPDGRPFYADPSTRHVPYDPDNFRESEFHKAEEHGLEFIHHFPVVTMGEFIRLREYLIKARPKGYWSSHYNVRDDPKTTPPQNNLESFFAFTDEGDSQLFDEARVWVMLKYD